VRLGDKSALSFSSFRKPSSYQTRRFASVATDLVIGVLIGVFILHPITTLVFWVEFQGEIETTTSSMWSFAVERLFSRSLYELGPMTVLFSFLGGMLGLTFGWIRRYILEKTRLISVLEVELEHTLPDILTGGENDRVEFKETLRWNVAESRVDKRLEFVVAKTICGMMNHKGGSLLIGVGDDGTIKGLDRDFQTLKLKSADGFELSIVAIVQRYLGGSAYAKIQCFFPHQEKLTICWILIEPSKPPIFLKDVNLSKYFVRAGNSTRELDAAETVKHRQSKTSISRLWDRR